MENAEWRVLSGVGLVQVRTAANGMVEIWEDPTDKDDSYLESEADLAEHIRPVISKLEANTFVDQLSSTFPTDRLIPPDQRLRTYQAAFDTEDFATLVDALHRMYNTPDATAADRSNIDRFEGAVLAELAVVLGTSPARLRNHIRQSTGANVVPAAVELPDCSAELALEALAPIDGWEPVGAFAIEATLSIGDRPLLAARPGIWHARYVLDDFGIPSEIVLAHSDVSAQIEELLPETTPDEFEVGGSRGTMFVCDGALRGDRDWEANYGQFDDLEIYGGRGFQAYMEADGNRRPGIVLDNDQAVLVHITNA